MNNFEALSLEPFKKELSIGESFLIDLRTYAEVIQYGEIPGTKARYDVYEPDFSQRILKLPKEGKYLLYCWHGNRSEVVRNWMKEQGFRWVKDLAGGIDIWKD